MSQSGNSEIKRDLSRLQARRKAVIFLAVLACVPFVSSWSALGGEMHETIETIGRGLIAFCILGRAWCSLYIGGRKTKELTTYGPYSISRNPLYMFSFIGAAGAGAQSGSIIVALFFAIIAFFIFLPVILLEEKALHQVFGASYATYVQETP